MDPNDNTAAQRFAPPATEVADVAANGIVLVDRGARLFAVIVDVSLFVTALWIVGKLTPWNVFSRELASADFGTKLAVSAASFVLFMLLNGYLLARRGQTLGKIVLRLRIVRPDGSAADALRLIGLRYGVGSLIQALPVVGNVYGLIDALLIFRANRRCLHDLIADTIVIKA